MDSNFKILYVMVGILWQLSIVNIKNIAIISIKNGDYHCIIHSIIKPETINLLKKSPLENQGCIRKNVAKIISFNRVISYKNFPK